MASISAGVFAFNSSVHRVFPFLFLRASILVGLTLNAVTDSLSPWKTKYFVTPCTNPFLRFPNAELLGWISIGSCGPCTLMGWVRYLSLVVIVKWASGLPVACDVACIISGISILSFSVSIERSTSLNNIFGNVNLAPPVMVVVVVLDVFMLLVVAVTLT